MLLLALHLLQFPNESFNTTHDSSSSASFEYYAAKKVQFGTELYQNVGPFGYAHYSGEYAGYLHWEKILLKNLSRLTLLILICWMLRSLNNLFAQFSLIITLFAPYIISNYPDLMDNFAYLTIYLMAFWLLRNPSSWLQWLLRFSGWFFLAFISLNKNIFFMVVCCIVPVIIFQNIIRRRLIVGVTDTAIFIVSLAATWTLAGQRLVNLPDFALGIFAFTSGYNEAFAIATHPLPLISGIIVLSLFSTVMIFNWWHGDKKEFGHIVIGYLLVFILWKHGFVRADEHILIFFYGVLLFAIPSFYYTPYLRSEEYSATSRKYLLFKVATCSALYLICLISYYSVIHRLHNSGFTLTELAKHLSHNVSWIQSPLGKTIEMDKQLSIVKSTNRLPATIQTVGAETIDFFGYEPGYLLLNNLNYLPRPMPITFAATNRYLQEANERFYRDPLKAPRYVLYQNGSIDNRFSLQDDALAKRELLRNYRFILIEKELLLFQRKKIGEMSNKIDEIIGEEVINFGQSVRIKDLNEKALWLEVEIEHTIAGKLLALIYKMPPCYINLKFYADETIQTKKFVAGMGSCGFMVNPYLEDGNDITNFVGASSSFKPGKRVSSISFSINDHDKLFFGDRIRLRWKLIQ